MATIPAQRTWTDGETVTGAMLNSNVRDAVNFFVTNRPKALLRQTVAQSLTTGVPAPITFDAEDLDNDAGHSTVSNTSRYTAQTAGWYRVSGLVCISVHATGQRTARLAVNGTVVPGSQSQWSATGTGSTDIPTPSRLVYLNVGDYVELQGSQNAGVSLNTAVTSGEQSMLSITWEGS